MLSVPRMNRSRRRYLVSLGRASGDPATALRFQAIAKAAAGWGATAVASALDIAISTVVGAAKRYAALGIFGLLDQRCGNGQVKVDDNFRRELVEVLTKSPPDFGWERPTWTRELLCLEMANHGFARVAPCTMGRALRAIRARLGSPKPIVLCPWPRRRRMRRLRELARLAASATESRPVYFADEVDIHLNPKIGRDWMLPGTQRLVVTPGKNAKNYIAGALNAADGKLVCVEDSSKCSALFCRLLWQLASRHPAAKTVHVILDNYIIHTSKLTQQNLRSLGGRIVLHFLPPYCPDANRIERTWRELHANVTRNHRCRTMNELMHHVRGFIRAHNRRHELKPSLRKALKIAA
jgi:transposase